MPTIARFSGMVAMMFYNDHMPPHAHVYGNGFSARVDLVDLKVVEVRGSMRRKDTAVIEKWARDHLGELWENWMLARQKRPLRPIEE
ncbi:MAG: DUF4160 domain-containing protein [Alphaproteobacteria bacterium]|jgi:hypothetical protein|nr:DUF4160 domain-containing protein [Alphaproteobacteria bacterium]